MKPLSLKRRGWAAAFVILLILFLARPGVSRLKWRIVKSISLALARPVAIGSVHLRFLPRPGFDLENVIVFEDPAFGAEPMLRAPEVTAVVRLTSLVRGRLDISRLELTEPSLNLVRLEDGRWNWEELLERTERVPLAPTDKAKSERRPGFPYMEASSGRINFKTGAEKQPYALLNADFAVWQESENAWGVRLKAEPLRTDMSLSDTGLLRFDGTWQRAGSLRETPLRFDVEWRHGQLGQLTKLITGSDKGWRGDTQMEVTLKGTPASLQVSADASVHDFHRYDISASEGLGLTAHCEGKYSSADGMLRELFCHGPAGSGVVTLKGQIGHAMGTKFSSPSDAILDLALNLDNVPVNALAQLARRAKKDLPQDLITNGTLSGNFAAKKESGSSSGPQFEGRGDIRNLSLQSSASQVEFASASIPFELKSASNLGPHNAVRRIDSNTLPAPDGLHIAYGPFPVALGRPEPAQARGWLARSGFALAVRGTAEVSQALRLASLVGLQSLKTNAEGTAQLDLQIAGVWADNAPGSAAGFSPPKVTGTAQLRNVRALVSGVKGPIEIASAELKLLPDDAKVEKLNARAGGARWTGNLELPRGCGNAGACLVRFNLNTDELVLSDLRDWFGAPETQRHWYQVLSSRTQAETPAFLEKLRASGRVNADRFRVHSVSAEHASAVVHIEHGKMSIDNLRADVLGGKHRGDWQIDLTTANPGYSGSGTFSNISLEQVADAMHDPWISGTGNGNYRLSGSGDSTKGFWQSADGELHFDVRDGSLSHISLANEEPLRIVRWSGGLTLQDGKIEIAKGDLASALDEYEVSGTVSLGQALDFKFVSAVPAKSGAPGPLVYGVTGTLADPQVAQIPAAETQAQLKP